MGKKIKTLIIIILTLITVFIALMVTPIFKIKNVELTGNDKFTEENILSLLGIEKNETNLFSFNTITSKNKLYKNNYIKHVSFKKSFPDTLKIELEERKIMAYVPYLNNYLYLDMDGIVVDVKKTHTSDLPVVVGLKFDNFSIGSPLEIEDTRLLTLIREFSSLMQKYNLLGQVLEVNISDVNDIRILINKLEVILGTFEDVNWKISTLNEILKNLSTEEKGFLYLNDPTKPPRFSYLN